MRKRIALGILTTLVALPIGATDFVLDLADAGAIIPVAPGTELTFQVMHRLPRATYRYEILQSGLLDPFSADLVFAEAATDEEARKNRQRCRALLRGLDGAESEAKLRSAIARARFLSPTEECTEKINEFVEATKETLGTVSLNEGQRVVVTITRLEPERKEPWVFEFNTGQERRWLVHYGFSFVPDEDEEFFTKESSDDDGSFLVTRAADRSGAEFEPTVAFTYVPQRDRRSAWKPYFTAGLGADIDKRLVFAGASWLIGDNVTIFLGAAGHQQTRLKGIYEEGQVVQETLTGDQLVDETFEPNAILGIGFRFNRNPFRGGQQATQQPQEPEQPDQPEDPQTPADPQAPAGPQTPADPQAPDQPQPPDQPQAPDQPPPSTPDGGPDGGGSSSGGGQA